MAITPLPTPPTRADASTFSDRADTFLSALPTFADEANALQVDVNEKQVAAAASQVSAAAAQAAAEAASNAAIWVSGTTYAVGNVRFSPINFKSYRRKTAGAGTTDPSADSTNWQLLTGLGDVDLSSTQTLTNKTHSTGSIWNGTAVPIANGGTGATTAADAFIAIKQAASETATGVVELATTAEAAAGTDTTRAVTAAGVAAAITSDVTLSFVENLLATQTHQEVGTITVAWNTTTSNIASNGTIAGSSLRYLSAVAAFNASPNGNQFNYVSSGGTTFPTTNSTALSGTWKNIGGYCRGREGVDPYYWYPSLWIRIA